MNRQERVRYLLSLRFWLTPGMGVKRHVLLAVAGTLLLVLGASGLLLWMLEGNRQLLSDPIEGVLSSGGWSTLGGWLSVALLAGGLALAAIAVGRLNRSLLSNWMDHPLQAAEVLHRRLQLSKGPRIVALGGGTGLSTLLRGLREHTSNLVAVVTVSDDGGSSGRLRKEFDMPAPGDLSDCLAALSDNELELSRLLEYRFERGQELRGHTFGNLLITTLTEVEGDFGKALSSLNRLLNLAGAVYPAATRPVFLEAEKRGGERVQGESAMRVVPGPVERVLIEPQQVGAPPQVAAEIRRADLLVLGPGSLFTSTIPPLLVPEVRAAVLATQARIVYVCNIMTEAGETDGFTAFDHVAALERHLGRYPDWVVVNATPVDPARVAAYREEAAEVVGFDPAPFAAAGIRVAQLELLAEGPHAKHDADALADWLVELWRRPETGKARVA